MAGDMDNNKQKGEKMLRGGLETPLSLHGRVDIGPAAKINRKYRIRYPWSEWFASDTFTLSKGKHFNIRADIMAQQIRNAAGPGRYNVSVAITINDDGSVIQVTVYDRK